MAGFEIKTCNSKKGKAMFSTKNYEPGDIILEEDPLVSCQFAWNAAYKYIACDHCMRPLETPEQNVRRLSAKQDIVLPHPDCFDMCLDNMTSCEQCGAYYCSESCRQQAYTKYHRTICYDPNDIQHPIVVLLEAWKPLHYPPETTSIMLLVRILAYIQQSPDPSSAVATIRQFCHRTVNEDEEIVHKLLGEQFVDQLNMLRELTANVVSGEAVQEIKAQSTSEKDSKSNTPRKRKLELFLTPDGFCSLMALVGTNGQGIGTSPLAMWVAAVLELSLSDDERRQLDLFLTSMYDKVQEESGSFLNTEGSGLYVQQSACNHSCAPNAEASFPLGNHRLQLRALRPVRPGDEVCISYLDDCFLQRSRHSRQKELAQNYLFICECQRCQQDSLQPECTSEEDMSDDEDADD